MNKHNSNHTMVLFENKNSHLYLQVIEVEMFILLTHQGLDSFRNINL